MANVLTGRYLYFDSTTGAEVVGHHRIIGVFWLSNEGTNLDIAADDDFLLEDSAGLDILGKRAEGAGDGLEQFLGWPGIPVNGIVVKAMDGGVCHIWLAEEVRDGSH